MMSTDHGPVEIPEDAPVIDMRNALAHMNAEWAQAHPHKAWQIHTDCEIDECIAKNVAWGELVRCGEMPIDSSVREDGPIGYFHNGDGLTAIGADGFPFEGEAPEGGPLGELSRYGVIDIEPDAVTDTPLPPT